MNNRSIGIFDSGIGGLTVAKQIIQTLPNENIIYLGDTARVPYGTRDRDSITKFSLELASYLLQQNVKALVVACNSISATCLDAIQELSPVPVIGVIKPTAQEAVAQSKTGKIGVIGTRATIASKVYEDEIHSLDHMAEVVAKACPLFVPLAEEGFFTHPATKLITKEYLSDLKESKIDTLILGCTHYPLLSDVIQEIMGEGVQLINSAKPTAATLKKLLEANNLLGAHQNPAHKFLLTDVPANADHATHLFFNNHFPGKLEKVNL